MLEEKDTASRAARCCSVAKDNDLILGLAERFGAVIKQADSGRESVEMALLPGLGGDDRADPKDLWGTSIGARPTKVTRRAESGAQERIKTAQTAMRVSAYFSISSIRRTVRVSCRLTIGLVRKNCV